MSKLQEIFEHKKTEIEFAKSRISIQELQSIALDQEAPRDFLGAIQNASGLALIAEVKKASPSEGTIRADLDPADVAKKYERVGATCLSVLTDERYFQGCAENLRIAKRTVSIPCLRKDFMCDPYQIYEARAWGADAILLIASYLERTEIEDLQALANSLGMAALVEVHNETELENAILAKSSLTGVNNRDLKQFTTDVVVSERLIPLIKQAGALAVSESGLRSKEDLDRMRDAGADAVLIGTTFCKSPDIEGKVREVMGW